MNEKRTNNKIITLNVNTRSGLKKFSIFKNTLYPFKIFKGQSYPLYSKIMPPKIIFDVGANIGAASFYFAENYPKASIFSFEPCSEINDILKKNLKNYKNIIIIQKALSNKNIDKTKLYVDAHNFDGSSLYKEYSKTNNLNINNYELVEAISCDFFCKKNKIKKIDILKIDAEGSELDIVESLSSYLNDISVIYLECHNKKNFIKIGNTLSKTHLCIRSLDKKNYMNESIFMNKKYKVNN